MTSVCPGCGSVLPEQDGPIHAYMTSSPACFAAFGRLLEAEYSDYSLARVHRLTVDTWAVQHPGDPRDRRAVQSVGLHLARLLVTDCAPSDPGPTNRAMGDFADRKASLPFLPPPPAFTLTVADIAPHAGTPEHEARVVAWAQAIWNDWSDHHDVIRDWVAAG